MLTKEEKEMLKKERAKVDRKVKRALKNMSPEKFAEMVKAGEKTDSRKAVKDMKKAKAEFDKGLKLLDELTKSYKKFFMHTIKVSGSREKVMCLMYSVHHSLACLEMDELNRVWPLDGTPKTPAK